MMSEGSPLPSWYFSLKEEHRRLFGFDTASMIEVKLAYDKLGGPHPVTPEGVRQVSPWPRPEGCKCAENG